MRQSHAFALAVCVVLLATCSVRAEAVIHVERNSLVAAKPGFAFDKTPEPSKIDAATNARFEIIDGRADANSGGTARLNDGQTPTSHDQPGANFFFDAGTTGGRLLLDLENVRDIRRVSTYSWHVGSRAPQVYKLYASEGRPKDFARRPTKSTDLEKAGWKLLASVDTRTEEASSGGQHAVSITGEENKPLGEYRYLLFDISSTDEADRFSNTFFSEIDVDDGEEHEREVVALTSRGENFEITYDFTDTPDLKKWCETRLMPACEEWYPRIVCMLPSDGYEAPRKFSIVFHSDMSGVAYTARGDVHCAADWFRRNLEGEAVGAVVHELVHVVQQYGRGRDGRRPPGWLVEGLADYIRWFQFEPKDQRPKVNPARANYTDGYRTTAAFLNYVVEKHDAELIQKLNAAMRRGKYDADLWKEYTGKDLNELWQQFVAAIKAS